MMRSSQALKKDVDDLLRMHFPTIQLGQVDETELVSLYRPATAWSSDAKVLARSRFTLNSVDYCGNDQCTSLREVLKDGVTGILCPPDEAKAFVAAIRRLAANRRCSSDASSSASWSMTKFSGKHGLIVCGAVPSMLQECADVNNSWDRLDRAYSEKLRQDMGDYNREKAKWSFLLAKWLRGTSGYFSK